MSGGHDIAMALRAAYWAMHRQADAALAPWGVTADQFVLLSLIADGEGADRAGVSQQSLVRGASSDANTVGAMLGRLEAIGLVSRQPHPTDGRARVVALTAKGRRTYERAWAGTDPFRARLSEALGGCDPADAERLVQHLARIASTMTPAPANAGRTTRLRATTQHTNGRSNDESRKMG